MIRPLSSILPTSLLFCLATPAFATVIFDTGAPSSAPDVSARLSDVDASASGSGLRQQVAGFFSLQPGASTITDIHWFGIYGRAGDPQLPLVDDKFTVRIFSYSSATGVSVLPDIFESHVGNNVNRTDTGADVVISGGSYDIFSYAIDIPSLALAPNQFYALSIVNDTTNALNSWSWSQTDAANPAGFNAIALRFTTDGSNPDGTSWSVPPAADLSFSLTSVPEPNLLALIGLGLAGMGFSRRKTLAAHT